MKEKRKKKKEKEKRKKPKPIFSLLKKLKQLNRLENCNWFY